DLNPLDEAGAYQQLIEAFGLTHAEVARRVGKSRTVVTNSLRLFQLPPGVQRQVRDNLLTAGHARALLASPDRALQEKLALEVVRDGLSVRVVEDKVRAALRADAAVLEEMASTGPDRPTGSGGEAPLDTAGAPGRPGLQPSLGGASATRLRPPGLLDLEELLGDYLNTRVAVDMSAKHGRVVIEFANLDDLERIYRLIIGGNTAPE
ncbi:MAG: ParB/RepB/Spo0J family partition protein, partial [Acidimicrobiales bacterium]